MAPVERLRLHTVTWGLIRPRDGVVCVEGGPVVLLRDDEGYWRFHWAWRSEDGQLGLEPMEALGRMESVYSWVVLLDRAEAVCAVVGAVVELAALVLLDMEMN